MDSPNENPKVPNVVDPSLSRHLSRDRRQDLADNGGGISKSVFCNPVLDLLDLSQNKETRHNNCDNLNLATTNLSTLVFSVKTGVKLRQDLAFLSQKGGCDSTCQLRSNAAFSVELEHFDKIFQDARHRRNINPKSLWPVLSFCLCAGIDAALVRAQLLHSCTHL